MTPSIDYASVIPVEYILTRTTIKCHCGSTHTISIVEEKLPLKKGGWHVRRTGFGQLLYAGVPVEIRRPDYGTAACEECFATTARQPLPTHATRPNPAHSNFASDLVTGKVKPAARAKKPEQSLDDLLNI
jgi:hypothetical protein